VAASVVRPFALAALDVLLELALDELLERDPFASRGDLGVAVDLVVIEERLVDRGAIPPTGVVLHLWGGGPPIVQWLPLDEHEPGNLLEVHAPLDGELAGWPVGASFYSSHAQGLMLKEVSLVPTDGVPVPLTGLGSRRMRDLRLAGLYEAIERYAPELGWPWAEQSSLISAGCSVKAVANAMGHQSPTITLTTYASLWPGDEDRICSAIERAWTAEDSVRTGSHPFGSLTCGNALSHGLSKKACTCSKGTTRRSGAWPYTLIVASRHRPGSSGASSSLTVA
jgi:hypothetical protein